MQVLIVHFRSCFPPFRSVAVKNKELAHPSPWKPGGKVSAEGHILHGLDQVAHAGVGASHRSCCIFWLCYLGTGSPLWQQQELNLPVQMLQATYGGLSSLLNKQEGRVDTGGNSRGQKSCSECVVWQFCCDLKLNSLRNYLEVTATVQTGKTTNVIGVLAAEGTMAGVTFPFRVTPPLLSHLRSSPKSINFQGTLQNNFTSTR